MGALTPAPESRPRLNPFAFPTDTTSRLFSLLIFVAAADIAYWHGVAVQLGGTITEFGDCLQGWPASGSDIREPQRLAPAMRCVERLARSELPWLGFGLVLLVFVTFAVYWLFPVWKRRRLKTFPEEEFADIVAVLHQLCAVAGLARHPVFLLDPLNPYPRPIAFGRSRCYFVKLTGADVKRFYVKRDSFRAIVLHELAHIRNGDITKTYLTIAVSLSFVATALAPYLAVEFILDHSLWNVLDALIRILLFGALVWFSLTAVLRARECYADVRASSWGQKPALAAAIDTLLPDRWWLKLHPDPAFRLSLLEDTKPLFRAGTWDHLGIGAGATIAFFILAFLLAVVVSRFTASLTGISWLLVPALAIVPLLTVSTGSMVWRSTFVDYMRGRPRRSTARTAFAVAAGITLGGPLFLGYPVVLAGAGGAGKEFVAGGSLPLSLLLVSGAALLITALLLLTGVFMLYLSWIQAGVRGWLPVALRLPVPHAVWIAGLAVAAVLAIPWFAILPVMIVGSVYEIATAIPSLGAAAEALLFGFTRMFPTDIILWVSIIGVWAYPMAAALWRQVPNPVTPAWAFLDGSAPVDVISPLRPRRALLVGLIGGAVGGVAILWTPVDLSAEVLRGGHLPETPVLIAVMAQVATGIAAALAVPRLAFVHAMFAAFAAGLVLLITECLRVLSWGTNADLAVLLDVLIAPTLVGGAIATLPLAAIVAALVDRRA